MHGACDNARRSSSKGNYANEMSICSSVKTRRSVARWVATRPTSHDARRRFKPSEGILYSASWFRPARVQGGSGPPQRRPLMPRSDRDIVSQYDDYVTLYGKRWRSDTSVCLQSAGDFTWTTSSSACCIKTRTEFFCIISTCWAAFCHLSINELYCIVLSDDIWHRLSFYCQQLMHQFISIISVILQSFVLGSHL